MSINTDIIKKKLKVTKRKEEIIVGILSKHKKGFGFVIPENDQGGDVFYIASRNQWSNEWRFCIRYDSSSR